MKVCPDADFEERKVRPDDYLLFLMCGEIDFISRAKDYLLEKTDTC